LASFKAEAEVTPEVLQAARLLRDPRNPVAILGRGELKTALKVRVHRVYQERQSQDRGCWWLGGTDSITRPREETLYEKRIFRMALSLDFARQSAGSC